MRIGAACLLLAACSPEGELDEFDELSLEVGEGRAAFIELADEALVEIVLGAQGGWHVDLGARVAGARPAGQFITYRIWDIEGGEQIAYPIKASIEPAEVVARVDGFEQHGIRTVFAIDDPSDVVGRQGLLEAELIQGIDVIVDRRVVTFVDNEP